MDVKLTLKLDNEVIEKAKVYAESRGESLSRIVENYFLGLTQETGGNVGEPKGVVAELAGLLAGAEIVDEKEAYAEHLSKKYS